MVLVAALVIGSGVLKSSVPSPSERALTIESSLRCPSCEDLSVADSTAPTAVTVRETVVRQIAEGRSNQQIEEFLASRYGSSIVLVPPASGWSLLVWLIPILGGLVALAGLSRLFVRRRRLAMPTDPVDDARKWVQAVVASEGPAGLGGRRRFLVQSLADAEAEHRAGDLSDHDFSTLHRRDSERLAEVDARMAAIANDLARASGPGGADTSPSGPSGAGGQAQLAPAESNARSGYGPERHRRPRRQRVLLGGAIAAFGIAAVLGVSLTASHLLPGQTITGTIELSRHQQMVRDLDQAATEENDNQPGLAAQLYERVLRTDPENEVALAQFGWLEYETGASGADRTLMNDGKSMIERAVHLDAGDYAAHLYLGTVLYQFDGDASGAVLQYRQFLAEDPPRGLVEQAASVIRKAYVAAGTAPPASVQAG